MFIEKISDKSIARFVGKYNAYVKEIKRKDNSIYVACYTDNFCPTPEFSLKDFEAEMLNNYTYYNEQIKNDWRVFLFSTFGKEYKDAIENYFNNQKESVFKDFEIAQKKKENNNEF